MTVAKLRNRASLEVLERLKQAVAEFAKREERMTRAWRRARAESPGATRRR